MEATIAQFEQYLQSRYPHSPTSKHYGYDLRQFSRLIDKRPRAITRKDVDRFIEEQLGRGLAASTVNRRLTALHEYFEYVAAEEDVDDWPNPVQWSRHKVRESKPLPRDASEAEIVRLFEQITQPRDVAMFRLMLDVGLRVGEVAKLCTDDLTLEADGQRGRLRIQGKGNKERFVWLLDETLQIVQAWLDVRPAVTATALFITRRKQAFSVRGIQERLTHYCRLAGVKLSPHQLRHSFGRRMAEANMPVTSLAALLGHEQVTTTQIYISGAGLNIQADYQVAIGRLQAERPTANLTPRETVVFSELSDVWSLAGVEPSVASSALEPDQVDVQRYWEDLPLWLAECLEPYIRYRQRRWKPSQVAHHTRVRLQTLRGIWRWLLDEEHSGSLADLRRTHLQHFVDTRLTSGISPSTVNRELSELWALLRYYEERGVAICPSVFRIPRPKEGERLPRFLSEEAYRRLEQQVIQATQTGTRDDWLNRAWFYLLSEAGLRLGEVRDLRLGDIDLAAQRLLVRAGKGNRDRSVPLSPKLLTSLRNYLPLRGPAQSDHLLLYREQPLKPTFIQGRLRRCGQQVCVNVSPHRLRHTLATRLLNEGMPITSLQRFLGHEHVATTLIYARVHNETVQRDYERAYARLNASPALAEELFKAPTQGVASQSVISKFNCV
ncbi:MAG: tyrosine-type recombinase/integrase [bacterium]|nr:tyrosine-type recombinase/integrase [bacterium]